MVQDRLPFENYGIILIASNWIGDALPNQLLNASHTAGRLELKVWIDLEKPCTIGVG